MEIILHKHCLALTDIMMLIWKCWSGSYNIDVLLPVIRSSSIDHFMEVTGFIVQITSYVKWAEGIDCNKPICGLHTQLSH